MPKQCPFDPKKKCGKKSVTACVHCDIRRKVGQVILTKEPPTTMTRVAPTVEKTNCPYCLHEDYASRFQIRNKSGKISEKRFLCPDCGEIMRKDTLFKQMSVEEYAEWIYDTRAWDRISFSKFRQRLKDMGISYQFWEHYKKYKVEQQGSTESYEDYVLRKQQEERDAYSPGGE